MSGVGEVGKLVVSAKRAPGCPVEKLHAAAAPVVELPGLRRHVRSLTLPGGYRRGEPVYDVVHELWFDDEDTAWAATDTTAFRALTAGPLLDPASVAVIVTAEHVVVDGPVPAGGVKNIEYVTRRADLPREEFGRYWAQVHGPLAAHIAVIRRYVQSHTVPAAYERAEPPLWDGVAITWFDDVAAMRRSATTPEYAATRADEPNFLAPGELPFLIMTEHEVPTR
ncbi:EthD domain-containing protein [Pseudonocardia bannensis]|uniref:EthD domain-containing protein n=1 Tax=Pseudonocardia bannensis TaxID=630973 RepID=A0A848DPL8_9PSEU|nr:EthD domain-containing protein [Pseudonocardia bannensis]NMH94386.1 EthD domain-containing protein [Pseudonocardia bannensis]